MKSEGNIGTDLKKFSNVKDKADYDDSIGESSSLSNNY